MKHLGSLESTQEARVALGYASSVTTVQGATFSMRGQLYCGHINATALFSSPVVSALGSKSDDPVLVLAGARHCDLETCRKKKMQAPLLGLAKSIYYPEHK